MKNKNNLVVLLIALIVILYLATLSQESKVIEASPSFTNDDFLLIDSFAIPHLEECKIETKISAEDCATNQRNCVDEGLKVYKNKDLDSDDEEAIDDMTKRCKFDHNICLGLSMIKCEKCMKEVPSSSYLPPGLTYIDEETEEEMERKDCERWQEEWST